MWGSACTCTTGTRPARACSRVLDSAGAVMVDLSDGVWHLEPSMSEYSITDVDGVEVSPPD